MCKICNKHEETIDHIISGCPELAKTDYLERYNKAAAYIHWKASQRGGRNTSPKRLPKIKKSILWDMQIHTDKELSTNKPDVVIMDHANWCCKLIDVSNRNTSTKVNKTFSKHRDLEIETSRKWGVKTEAVAVIVGALGHIRKGMEQNLGKIPRGGNINELQRIVL